MSLNDKINGFRNIIHTKRRVSHSLSVKSGTSASKNIRTEEQEIELEDIKLAKALWPFIRPYLRMLCFTALLVFTATSFELFIPYLTGKAFDGFIIPAASCKGVVIFGFTIDSFKYFSMLFSCFIIILFVIDFCQSVFMEYTGQKIILNLRCFLFSHMCYLPVAFYDKNSSGRLVSRVAGDIENMNEMFTSVLIFILKDILLMAGILVILFTMDVKLAFYLSLLVPVIIVSVGVFSKRMRKIFRTMRQKISEINHSFSEAITGIKTIKTNSSQDVFLNRFKQLNFEYFTAGLSQIKIFSTFMPFMGFLGVVSVAIIIYAGSFEIIDKAMTLGELVAFLTYMKLFFRPLRELSEKFNMLQNALSSTERIVHVLNRKQAESKTKEKKNFAGHITDVSFKNVNFSYDGHRADYVVHRQPQRIRASGKYKNSYSKIIPPVLYKERLRVLKDISFNLDHGKSVGIVGKTGSGKSSIVNLIAGFYAVDSGAVLFNGIDQTLINIKDIRKRIALVLQDPLLFSGTVRENISPEDKDVDDSILLKALKDAKCDFLFKDFAGLDTIIKEGGRPLSSGQKQLVCIARAFAFNPDLIIFDEATSYMDSGSEQDIHKAMGRLMKGRLAVIIAHRLSTVRKCDTILVLRNGRIVERGSHHKLVKLKSLYYHLLKKERV